MRGGNDTERFTVQASCPTSPATLTTTPMHSVTLRNTMRHMCTVGGGSARRREGDKGEGHPETLNASASVTNLTLLCCSCCCSCSYSCCCLPKSCRLRALCNNPGF